ncbi:MAG TPA: DegT/DnrJ/EryC1/StrS family aminotransferase [Acidimicrobiia bacterium]|nr:DegT/DnrJ/EryC1/StrS family aminotransferase [Acidimicrobiia bacterium]
MAGAEIDLNRSVVELPIPIAGPWITDREVEAVADAARDGWYGHAYDAITAFETAFAEYCDRRYAIALPSCTAGIHLSLAALGVGPGDEVIVPESTWIASASPVSYVGATPVFVDVDPVDWCLSVDRMEEAITDRTRAVVVVDLYGGLPPMDKLLDVCRRHGLALVEDAAEAVGASFRGRRAGGFGETSVFSFHGTKTLTTHEGGMVLTDDAHLYQRMLTLRDQGRAPGAAGEFWNLEIAFKYKISAVQAAMGLVQLQRVDELVGRKRQIFDWYRERLGGVEGLTLNAEPEGVVNGYWMTTVVLDERFGLTKKDVISALVEKGAIARPFFHPLSSLPAYAGFPGAGPEAAARNPVSYRLGTYGVNLPSALKLVEVDVDYVAEALLGLLAPTA